MSIYARKTLLVDPQVLSRLKSQTENQEIRQVFVELNDSGILWFVGTKYPATARTASSGRAGWLRSRAFGRERFGAFDFSVELEAEFFFYNITG